MTVQPFIAAQWMRYMRIIIVSTTATCLFFFYKYVCFCGSDSKDRRGGAFSSNHIKRAFDFSYPLILDSYSAMQFVKKDLTCIYNIMK